MPRRVPLLVLVFVVACGAVTGAQFRRFSRVPPREPTADSFDGGFNFCRGMYTQVRSMRSGMGWGTDYPDADINFSIRLSELTKTRVSRRPDGEPNHFTVRLTDDNLFNCRVRAHGGHGLGAVHRRGGGTAPRVPAQGRVPVGRRLLGDRSRGGTGRSRSAACCRPAEYPIRDLPPDHPLFSAQYPVKGVPQIPSIRMWTSRRQYVRGSARHRRRPRPRDQRSSGRLMVFMTHNTDIADAWEREGGGSAVFLRVRSERVRARHQRRALRAQPLNVRRSMKRLALACCLAALAAVLAGAQGFGQRWGRMRYEPPRFPTADSFDGFYNFCRGMYDSDRREGGGQGWSTDYPDADINFSIRLSELTKTRISMLPNGEPNHLVVRLTDDAIFKCPIIEMEDVGTIHFTRGGGRPPARVPAEGRVPVRGRFLGRMSVGPVGRGDRPRPAAEEVSHRGHRAGAPALSHDVHLREDAADSLDQFVEAHRRRDLRARRGERRGAHARHHRSRTAG